MITEKLKRLIELLPDKPGCYLMKDADDKIIYIGKAKSLKKRVSQYFLRPQEGKVAAMVSHVDHFDIVLVGSDKEAFILEMNLIQTHYPRYNIMLMDDSHYPYIALKRHKDPLLKIARSTKDNNYFYFGPFPNSGSAYEVINLLNKIYPTRKCRNIPDRPCLYYSMGQCLAPCIKPLEDEVAEKLYNDIKKFMNGDVGEVKAEIRKRMMDASDRMDYESAAEYKKTLDSLEYITAKQSVELVSDNVARDVFAFAERDGYRSLSILTYRRGLLLGKSVHAVPSFGDVDSQILDLVEQYYSNHDTPKEIAIRLPSLKETIESEFEGVSLVVPKEGRLMDAIHLAELNARQGLDAHFMSARLDDDNNALLEQLGELLHIKTPYRIELFDNSHLQGSSPVGAMVCYINGEPAKKMYRKFHLSEENAGDDYHSMKEVVSRRYKRLKDENQSMPDLLLADGGLTQVHACQEAFDAIDVHFPVFGLYKNDKHQTEGLIDGNGNTYPLDPKSPLFFLLMRMQDEVHRFAISFHRSLRGKSMTADLFSDIKGLGPKRRELLNRQYPSIDALMSASVGELSQIIPPESAEALFQKLHGAEN
ncbi:MAG: excinuclease ABC subunit UvrC [Bacilli bacterium]|nr:excinuclease ABC subunit UvrC [Bacilli bacterium]